MESRIAKWKEMEAAGDPNATSYLKEITAQAKAEGKLQEMNAALEYLVGAADKHLDNVESSLNSYTMHQRMGQLTEVVNLATFPRQS